MRENKTISTHVMHNIGYKSRQLKTIADNILLSINETINFVLYVFLLPKYSKNAINIIFLIFKNFKSYYHFFTNQKIKNYYYLCICSVIEPK